MPLQVLAGAFLFVTLKDRLVRMLSKSSNGSIYSIKMNALPVNTKLQGGGFTVGKPLGQGGFGITYYGIDNQLKRYVAIKEFFPEGCTRQDSVVQSNNLFDSKFYESAKAGFLEEARVLAQFRHSGIVQIYTFFEENHTA